MGLLNKIRDDHDTPAVQQPSTTLDGNGLDGKPLEPAAPCPTCRSPHFWRSAYGDELHCAVCDPWPSLAMVGERWTIYTRPDGALAWVPCIRRGERAKDLEDQPRPDDGICSAIVEDEEGTWLVISKTKQPVKRSTL